MSELAGAPPLDLKAVKRKKIYNEKVRARRPGLTLTRGGECEEEETPTKNHSEVEGKDKRGHKGQAKQNSVGHPPGAEQVLCPAKTWRPDVQDKC